MSGMLRQTKGYELYGSPIHQTYYFAILVSPHLYLQVLELGALYIKRNGPIGTESHGTNRISRNGLKLYLNLFGLFHFTKFGQRWNHCVFFQ